MQVAANRLTGVRIPPTPPNVKRRHGMDDFMDLGPTPPDSWYCCDWDFMEIFEGSPEAECCSCKVQEELKAKEETT